LTAFLGLDVLDRYRWQQCLLAAFLSDSDFINCGSRENRDLTPAVVVITSRSSRYRHRRASRPDVNGAITAD